MVNRFIVCGASRAGKSVLSRRLKNRFHLNWIIGDALVSSLEDAFPDIGISHHGDLYKTGDKLETFIKYLLWNYHYEGGGYVFDTTHLYPRHIVSIRQKIGPVPTVFLGYAEADVQEKLKQIRQHDPVSDWWTSDMSDDELKKHIMRQITKSHELSEECKKFDIPYIETSKDFERAIHEAEKLLV